MQASTERAEEYKAVMTKLELTPDPEVLARILRQEKVIEENANDVREVRHSIPRHA